MTLSSDLFRQVWLARIPTMDYRVLEGVTFPEIPSGVPVTTTLAAFRSILADMGLDRDRFGTPQWNPLSPLVPAGSSVVIKPNWVLHTNFSGEGMDCVVTHPSLLAALCAYLFKAEPGKVVLGDAPVQGCDFPVLMEWLDLERWIGPWAERISVRDFRLVTLPGGHFVDAKAASATRDPERDYLLFDLAGKSVLEPITDREETPFRVTMYDPDAMKRTHRPGRHQFLVAREMIEADVVFNLPKLKTHKKSGVTGALKNLIGINGHKEYLPHHRKGGAGRGGDCYPGGSMAKSLAEDLLDRANRLGAGPAKRALFVAAYVLNRLEGRRKARIGLEGSWHGNDTIWRTCMDLQRILHYGKVDGTLAETRQRSVWSLTDAILAGQGEGPLAPSPRPLGLLTLAASPVAAEWVHTLAMGLDPERIPIVREAFGQWPWPLVDFAPGEVEALLEGVRLPLEEIFDRVGADFVPPLGWQGHCERARV
ncbi:MAG TPA: DUF362 domain-containing protein [Holophaga sp.]|nr:DUF362 domain-containing protein [Holophaga sp.]